MIPHLFYYQLVVLGLLWLCVMLHAVWPSRGAESQPRPAEAAPLKSKRKRSREPKPFAGLTHKPHCALCAQQTAEHTPAPPLRPNPMPLTHRRPRTVDTSMHFCPHLNCDYGGWLGLNNLRANGHPSGGQWRQFHCTSCDGYFPEHHGFTAAFGDRALCHILCSCAVASQRSTDRLVTALLPVVYLSCVVPETL